MRLLTITFLIIFSFGCVLTSKKNELKTADLHLLDSLKRKSDTNWIKRYRNKEFATAEYYINKKDSIVTQVMKDTAGTIRQINVAKYDNVRLFFAEYYENGQLKAKLLLDSMGRYNGESEYYYQNGGIKSKGLYVHGFFYGKWENYDEKGRLISTDEYDANGQFIRTEKSKGDK